MAPEPPPWWLAPSDDRYAGDSPWGDSPPTNSTPRLTDNGAISQAAVNLNDADAANLPGDKRGRRYVPGEHINLFYEGLGAISPAYDHVAPHAGIWQTVHDSIQQAHDALRAAADAGRGPLQGQTFTKIWNNVDGIVKSLDSAAHGAQRMSWLTQMFDSDIGDTKKWFVERNQKIEDDWTAYQNTDECRAQVQHGGISLPDLKQSKFIDDADREARQTVREFYNPPIIMIGYNQPSRPANPQQVDQPPGGPQSPGGGGSPTRTPAMAVPPGLTAPGVGDLTDQPSGQPNSSNPGVPTQAATDAANQAGNAAKQAGNAAGQAGQQAAQAAQKALGDALKAGDKGTLGSLGMPPGGSFAHGAGNKMPKSGGSGSAGGAGARASTTAPPKAPVRAASAATVPASRASLSSGGAGSPGAGAPAAGRGAGAGGDKVHKAMKALHTTKNGEDVISGADAVVQVIGADQEAARGSDSTTSTK